jgi:cytoskeletal protein CcmA (bactofilin family)
MNMSEQTRRIKNLTMTGNATSHGGEFRRVRITGEGAVDGNLMCHHMRVVGEIDVGGDLHSEVIKVVGQLSVKGDCDAESFNVRGAFTVGGQLNAGKIEVRLFGPCQVTEMGGGQIRVKRNLPGRSNAKYLVADTVEGDNIQLECTRARVVRGNRVEIGPGCDIELVEYQSDLRKSPKANVKESRCF